ncbi:Transcriptional regulator, AraC family [Cystobacter fuscus DSM 2262]|uniref:Transcriptional regulator, AraC family n=1 Tax=Cystobacter fuscus (strain ATCC 25194 / DSM 2262 / NBRC 100088 / M29) TaxID=1242864 RepID=S9NZN0_CYSF2|nr:GlxA family transcriptional regulator [Cystobacter fuscus]EPX57640.1 Transcriptional regulator, AraC family [Cystobacter fuscus DSM 2262]
MTTGHVLAHIGLLLYPGAQMSAVHGLTDMFRIANRLAAQQGVSGVPALRVSHWRPDDGGKMERVFDTHAQAGASLVALILPPSLEEEPREEQRRTLARWIAARHAAGTTLCSICAGAFLLAETGLLDGRPATTHWSLAERLAERFPAIRLEPDKLLVEDGDIITAGGVMAWVDLGLRLVDRLLSPSLMLATARFFLADPSGREQRFYSHFSPKLHHGDEAILKVQHWLQARGPEKVTLPMMAAHAALGERTFLRRFQKATGLSPTTYVQYLRVGKARELLEFSNLSIEQVAWRVGYEDPGAFRKVFFKRMGLSPGDYRRRFSVTGHRGA